MTKITVQINHNPKIISHEKIIKLQIPIVDALKKIFNTDKEKQFKSKDISFNTIGYISSKKSGRNFELVVSAPTSNEIVRTRVKTEIKLLKIIKDYKIIPVDELTKGQSFIFFTLRQAPPANFRW